MREIEREGEREGERGREREKERERGREHVPSQQSAEHSRAAGSRHSQTLNWSNRARGRRGTESGKIETQRCIFERCHNSNTVIQPTVYATHCNPFLEVFLAQHTSDHPYDSTTLHQYMKDNARHMHTPKAASDSELPWAGLEPMTSYRLDGCSTN